MSYNSHACKSQRDFVEQGESHYSVTPADDSTDSPNTGTLQPLYSCLIDIEAYNRSQEYSLVDRGLASQHSVNPNGCEMVSVPVSQPS